MTCIVELRQGTNLFRWETGDETFVDADVTLAEGKKASTASIILADPLLQLFDEVPLPTKQTRITLDVWMHESLGEAIPPKVFSGFVQGYSPSITSGPNQLSIEASDKLKGGRRRRKAKVRRFSSAAQLANTIATENGLTVDLSRANLSDIEFSRVIQHGETDFTMLNRVMEEIGHKVKVRGDTLFIEELGSTRTTTNLPIVGTYGDNFVSFSPKINERTAARAANVYDFGGEQVQEDPDTEAEDRPVKIQRTGLQLATSDFPSFAEQTVLKAKKAQARSKRVFEGSVTLTGLYVNADTDDILVLERIGRRLSGVWNIDQIQLSYASRQTTFGVYNGGAE